MASSLAMIGGAKNDDQSRRPLALRLKQWTEGRGYIDSQYKKRFRVKPSLESDYPI